MVCKVHIFTQLLVILSFLKQRMLGLYKEGVSLGKYNTNETWAQLHKALTPLSTQNLKAMGLWVFILI